VWDEVSTIFLETMEIISIVVLFMFIIEFLELKFKDKIREKITERPVNQIVFASLLGAISAYHYPSIKIVCFT